MGLLPHLKVEVHFEGRGVLSHQTGGRIRFAKPPQLPLSGSFARENGLIILGHFHQFKELQRVIGLSKK